MPELSGLSQKRQRRKANVATSVMQAANGSSDRWQLQTDLNLRVRTILCLFANGPSPGPKCQQVQQLRKPAVRAADYLIVIFCPVQQALVNVTPSSLQHQTSHCKPPHPAKLQPFFNQTRHARCSCFQRGSRKRSFHVDTACCRN